MQITGMHDIYIRISETERNNKKPDLENYLGPFEVDRCAQCLYL